MLSKLNNRQLEAVEYTEGPMLVLAGAGSGKTRVLTTKIAYLIEKLGVYSGNILAITFTNKAAKEMKQRVGALLGSTVDGMWIGTFHAISVRILRMGAEKIGYSKNFTIYDRDDQKSLLKEIYGEMQLKDADLKYSGVISAISDAKNKEVTPEEYWEVYGNDQWATRIGAIYQRYERKKAEYNAFDFDDLIIKAIELLKKDPQTLDYYQRKFKYIFVDEYQDTNRSQYELVQLLSGFHKNLCVVGDTDQSIYGWRGADIHNILDFERDYPGAKTVLLEENYRSTQSILDAANRVIRNNEERREKNLWTDNDKGERPWYKQMDAEDAEGRSVVEWIDHLVYHGQRLSDMAILYRANSQSRQFEEALVRGGIPYVVVGGLKFYDRKEIKDLLAYLRIVINPEDNISLKRIINEPRRGIGAASIDKLEREAEDLGLSIYPYIKAHRNQLPVTGKADKGVQSFIALIEAAEGKLEKFGLVEGVSKIVESTGIPQELRMDGSVESRSRLENIESFISSIGAYLQDHPDADLEDYLASVSLMADVDKTSDVKSGVQLMTVHAAKGLEFDVVFLTGLEEGLFPSKFALDEGRLEEERRLFYVAVTRARKKLYLTATSLRRVYGELIQSKPSRFIEELEDTIEPVFEAKKVDYSLQTDWKRGEPPVGDTGRYLKYSLQDRKENIKRVQKDAYKIGDKVKHKAFGIGVVLNLTSNDNGEEEIMISFEKKGIKKLRTDLAPIEVIR
ncbi:MAG: 3'-5' exonuclease [Tissierellia bacterium]|nr:3'-5' exonuclease [Tissierellia bacterium]